MVLTRSNYDTERNESTARTSFNDGETTQMNKRNGETGDTDTPTANTIVPAAEHRSEDIIASTVTETLAPARSRRSNTSNKKLIAELEVKERLAKLELQRIQAAAELEKIRLMRIAAESSESETEEEEDLASRRIADWLHRRSGQDKEIHPISEERRDLAANAEKTQKRHENEEPSRPIHSMDVTSLTAALAAAMEASKSNKKLIPNLPTFSGSSQEWLHYKFAFLESAPSFSPSENVARIRMSLKGVALDAVSALLISRPQPEDIINALERRFGRPDALLRGEIEKIKSFPRLTGEPNDLCTFATRIANAVATIQLLEKPHYLYSTELTFTIVEKLTPILRNKWYDYAATTEDAPELKKIAAFLNIEADKCAAYAPPEKTSENRENIVTKKRPERTYTVTNEVNKNTKEKLCEICKESHKLSACPQFNEADVNTRWEMAKKNRVCYRCLTKNHRRFACRAMPCGHNGCYMRHHRLLHHERTPLTATAAPSDPHTSTNTMSIASATQPVAAAANMSTRAYLKIVEVTLRGPQTAIDTFALLDEGSTVTIIDASLADSLGLDGPIKPMWIQGVSGKEMAHEKSKTVNVAIKGKHNNEELQVVARTVSSLNFTTQSISDKDIKDCEHLEEINCELLYNNATPKILIGQDNWEIIVSREIRRGRRDQLVASRTALGWALHGCRKSQAEPISNFCGQLALAEPTDRMEDMMKEYFALESLSIEPRKPKSDPELRALSIPEAKSRRLPDGRYETGLLWRDENENMPCNRMDALKRLYTLERKLDRNEDLKRQYNERIDNLLKSNYAERANAPPRGRTWYLPYFAVCNPEKPKIRVVHDAAAKSHGRSLNDMLLPGPDLLQSLPGVIMRFRQHRIGVSSDTKEMFMQIKIREEDRDALRFLWRGDRREGDPEEYRMSSVIFGASSSPCTALYIKNKNAQEYASEFPHAAKAIERNHYMDDYLQSFATIEEAKRVTKDVNYVHKQAGFQLRGWATNVIEAISDVAGSEREKTTVPIGGSEMEKTLGLLWNTTEDCISFRLNTKRAPPEVLQDLRPPTKREALSIIMSIFDPLGLISPITTPAKRIMQDTWHYKVGWDEEIPGELHNLWSDWLRQLNEISDLSIPRCYDEEPAIRYELHTFVDASKEAMRVTLHEKYPSDETLTTLLAEVEATVNSRPLTYVSVDPDDPPALTPNMILIGPDCHSPAPGTFVEQDNVARKHWRRAQQLADTFWKRWVREYVPLLQQRREPHNVGVTPATGDLVVICDPNLPRNTWPRGKISKIYPDKDGIVRVVDVTTSRGHVLKRPTKKIVVLPV